MKFAVFAAHRPLQVLVRGNLKGIGERGRLHLEDAAGGILQGEPVAVTDHGQALDTVLRRLASGTPAFEIRAAGHRVVHGGDRFREPVVVDDGVIAYLESLVPLAPNHQPGSLLGITALRRLQHSLVQVACFDTAFHHGRAAAEQRFALPARPGLELVRRYGFHGLSYEYIAGVLPRYLGPRADGRVVVAHLGHGASLCALHRRRSVATTMTFTPLDGIPMGTRCGALDPAVVLYLLEQGMTAEAITRLLYFQSGVLGISGSSDDMAELLEQGTPESRQAIDYFIHHTVRAIGSLAAALEGIDALVFTAGIGEHSAAVREAVCRRLSWLGLELDAAANREGRPCISESGSRVQAWVIPTDEERAIAEHSLRLIEGAGVADARGS